MDCLELEETETMPNTINKKTSNTRKGNINSTAAPENTVLPEVSAAVDMKAGRKKSVIKVIREPTRRSPRNKIMSTIITPMDTVLADTKLKNQKKVKTETKRENKKKALESPRNKIISTIVARMGTVLPDTKLKTRKKINPVTKRENKNKALESKSPVKKVRVVLQRMSKKPKKTSEPKMPTLASENDIDKNENPMCSSPDLPLLEPAKTQMEIEQPRKRKAKSCKTPEREVSPPIMDSKRKDRQLFSNARKRQRKNLIGNKKSASRRSSQGIKRLPTEPMDLAVASIQYVTAKQGENLLILLQQMHMATGNVLPKLLEGASRDQKKYENIFDVMTSKKNSVISQLCFNDRDGLSGNVDRFLSQQDVLRPPPTENKPIYDSMKRGKTRGPVQMKVEMEPPQPRKEVQSAGKGKRKNVLPSIPEVVAGDGGVSIEEENLTSGDKIKTVVQADTTVEKPILSELGEYFEDMMPNLMLVDELEERREAAKQTGTRAETPLEDSTKLVVRPIDDGNEHFTDATEVKSEDEEDSFKGPEEEVDMNFISTQENVPMTVVNSPDNIVLSAGNSERIVLLPNVMPPDSVSSSSPIANSQDSVPITDMEFDDDPPIVGTDYDTVVAEMKGDDDDSDYRERSPLHIYFDFEVKKEPEPEKPLVLKPLFDTTSSDEDSDLPTARKPQLRRGYKRKVTNPRRSSPTKITLDSGSDDSSDSYVVGLEENHVQSRQDVGGLMVVNPTVLGMGSNLGYPYVNPQSNNMSQPQLAVPSPYHHGMNVNTDTYANTNINPHQSHSGFNVHQDQGVPMNFNPGAFNYSQQFAGNHCPFPGSSIGYPIYHYYNNGSFSVNTYFPREPKNPFDV